MQILVVTPGIERGYRVVEAASPTRAIFDLMATNPDTPPMGVKAPSAYPEVVTASQIKGVKTPLGGPVVYEVVVCQKRLDVEFSIVDGKLFNPYAELCEGRPRIQLVASNGQLTPFGELFL